MKITVEGKTYELIDSDDLTNIEIMAIEKETGQPISTWRTGTMSVTTGLVWATLKRENPDLKYRDVSFKMSDLEDDEDNDPDETEGDREGKDEELDS